MFKRFALIAAIASVSCYSDEKPKLDAVQNKYKTRIKALHHQYESKLAKLRAAMQKEYTIAITKEAERGNGVKASTMQQKVQEMKNEEQLVKDNRKPQFNIEILLNENVLRPKDVTMYNGHAYKLFNERLTWNEAKARCEEMGGYLVCIENQKEDELVRRLVGTSRHIFIGLERIGRTWKWVNGDPLRYKNWREGQGSRDTDQVGSILWDNIDVWDDHYKERVENGFVCEWNY